MSKGLVEVGNYEPTFEYVHVPMIASVFAILILLWYFVLQKNPLIIGKFQGNKVAQGGAPGTPAQDYLSYSGWYSAQYNADGAEAGYKTAIPHAYMPYNETIDGKPYPFEDL